MSPPTASEAEHGHRRGFGEWVAGNIAPILTITTLLGVISAGLAAVDGRYAKDRNVAELSQQLIKVSQRLELKIQEDNITNMQNRIWNLEDRIRQGKGSDLDERILREEKVNLEKAWTRLENCRDRNRCD
ncbi:MAG: hypothetical protein VKO65_09520 [Cyanobacteriota bacterium]|nr:hypothetical protein [Cyanobacteriota bacterium]